MGAIGMTIQEVGNAALYALLAGFLAFLVVYSTLARWWRSPAGRHVMAFMGACALVIGLRVISLHVGPYPGEWYVRVGALWLAVFVVWWRVAIVVRAQLAVRRGVEEKKDHEVHP